MPSTFKLISIGWTFTQAVVPLPHIPTNLGMVAWAFVYLADHDIAEAGKWRLLSPPPGPREWGGLTHIQTCLDIRAGAFLLPLNGNVSHTCPEGWAKTGYGRSLFRFKVTICCTERGWGGRLRHCVSLNPPVILTCSQHREQCAKRVQERKRFTPSTELDLIFCDTLASGLQVGF